jgi:hypothetical protein
MLVNHLDRLVGCCCDVSVAGNVLSIGMQAARDTTPTPSPGLPHDHGDRRQNHDRARQERPPASATQ